MVFPVLGVQSQYFVRGRARAGLFKRCARFPFVRDWHQLNIEFSFLKMPFRGENCIIVDKIL
jgi:hypothetical protein